MSKKKIIDTYFVSIGDFKFGILETLSNLADVKGVALDKWLNFFRYYEKNESLCIFVAKEFTESKTGTESQVIGAITVFIEPKLIHNCSFVCHIEDVVVRKGYENKGIGKILMNRALQEAKYHKCRKVVLYCKEELKKFYGKFGFETTGSSMTKLLT